MFWRFCAINALRGKKNDTITVDCSLHVVFVCMCVFFVHFSFLWIEWPEMNSEMIMVVRKKSEERQNTFCMALLNRMTVIMCITIRHEEWKRWTRLSTTNVSPDRILCFWLVLLSMCAWTDFKISKKNTHTQIQSNTRKEKMIQDSRAYTMGH